MLRNNLLRIKQRIAEACKKANLSPSDIEVIAVTKFIDEERINEAIALGITSIGENRAQEIRRKYPNVDSVLWNMIGVLQVNKVKMIIDLVDMIQSVDRKRLVDEIDLRAAKIGKCMNILIQVNIAREEQKSGVYVENLEELLLYAADKPNVKIMGFMAIMPDIEEETMLRKYFSEMKSLFDEYRQRNIANVEMKYLSMGMSGDFEIAIEEGANMIRLGSAIFQ